MPTPEQIAVLRAVARACLEILSWDKECPICGEDWQVDGHDDDCELVALVRIYPEVNQTGHDSYVFVTADQLMTNSELQDLQNIDVTEFR